jgi:hypothetical protein
MKAPQKSLKKWTKQKWRTKSGKPSGETGERYLPEKAIKSLSSAEYAATTKAKREGTAKGKQFVKQPKKIAEKTAKFRANEGGLAMYGMDKKKPMGMMDGGMTKKPGYKKGGMTKKKMGYAAGGVVKANCGASMKPNGKARK